MKTIGVKLNSINPNVIYALLKEELIDYIIEFYTLKQNISYNYLNEDKFR